MGKARSGTLWNNTNPEWDWERVLPIFHPRSIVQVQVMDDEVTHGDDLLGFVEFPIGDLPPGETISGWFILSKKSKLQGCARERLALLHEPPEEEVGAVFLDLTLNILSGDLKDEWYAHCLPEPEFERYPQTGFKRSREPMQAQIVFDKCVQIQNSLLFGFIGPVIGCGSYIFRWQEPALSGGVLSTCVFLCFFPRFFWPAVFAMVGIFLLLLKSPERRINMSSNPRTVELTDRGYSLCARTAGPDGLTTFLERAIYRMGGKVLDRSGLHSFSVASIQDGLPVTTYADLKRQLREASKVSDSFVKFDDKVLKDDTLVLKDGVRGTIESCINPKNPPGSREYAVKMDYGNVEPTVEEILGDDLEPRVSLEWLGNPTVLAFVPDVIEDAVTSMQPVIDQVADRMLVMEHKLTEVLSWQRERSAQTVVAVCFAASLLLTFCVVELHLLRFLVVFFKVTFGSFCLIIILYIFLYFTPARIIRTQLRANRESKRYKFKDAYNWPFFKKVDEDDALV